MSIGNQIAALTFLTLLSSDGQVIFTIGLVCMDAVPIFAAVVGITLTIIVDNEIVFVETVSYNVLVSVLVDLLV